MCIPCTTLQRKTLRFSFPCSEFYSVPSFHGSPSKRQESLQSAAGAAANGSRRSDCASLWSNVGFRVYSRQNRRDCWNRGDWQRCFGDARSMWNWKADPLRLRRRRGCQHEQTLLPTIAAGVLQSGCGEGHVASGTYVRLIT